jgi:hypothetical protein
MELSGSSKGRKGGDSLGQDQAAKRRPEQEIHAEGGVVGVASEQEKDTIDAYYGIHVYC